MPAMIQRDRHDKLDEFLGTLGGEAAQAEFLGSTAPVGSKMRTD